MLLLMMYTASSAAILFLIYLTFEIISFRMKLLTHNFLSSKFLKVYIQVIEFEQVHVQGAKAGYPLKLAATSVEQVTCDYDEGMLASTLKKVSSLLVYQYLQNDQIDYDVLKAAATSIGEGRDLPDQLPQTFSKYSQELKNEVFPSICSQGMHLFSFIVFSSLQMSKLENWNVPTLVGNSQSRFAKVIY